MNPAPARRTSVLIGLVSLGVTLLVAVGPAASAQAMSRTTTVSPTALAAALRWPVTIPLLSPVLERVALRGLAGTVRIGDRCSGSLVRLPGARDTAPARLLTAGHCTSHGLLSNGDVYVDEPSRQRGSLLDSAGRKVGGVRATRLDYATMTGTDVALYTLDRTYRQIREATGQRPRTLAAALPVDGDPVTMPSSQWGTTFDCRIQHVADTMVEGEWTFRNALRFAYPDDRCVTRGGTSGSPVVEDSTGKVVGVMSTYNFGNRAACAYENPCEKDGDRVVFNQTLQNYGAQTYPLVTCVDSRGRIKFGRAGCRLVSP